MDRIKTRAVIKIKVFNADSRIIFSTKNENIGKTTESNNYKTALTGDVAVNIKPPLEEKENIDLSGYKQIMEIYVPIKYNDEIVGVIVTYYKLDSLNEHIQATKRKICIAIGFFAVTILASFFIILSVVVINPVKKITDVSNKISNGDLNIHLPEIKTRDEIKDLNEALKGVFAVVELLTDEVKRLESKGKGNGISTS